MDRELEQLLRTIGRALRGFGPLLIPLLVIALPGIIRAVFARGRKAADGSPPPPPAADLPRGGDAEDDVVTQVKRMLEQRQQQQRPPASPRPEPGRAEPRRQMTNPGQSPEDAVEARGIPQRSDPARAPRPTASREPRRARGTTPGRVVRRAGEGPSPFDVKRPSRRELKARPPTQYAQYVAVESQATRTERAAAPAAAAAPIAEVITALQAPARELTQALLRDPRLALMAAEVLGPCRALREIHEGATSPVSLRDA